MATTAGALALMAIPAAGTGQSVEPAPSGQPASSGAEAANEEPRAQAAPQVTPAEAPTPQPGSASAGGEGASGTSGGQTSGGAPVKSSDSGVGLESGSAGGARSPGPRSRPAIESTQSTQSTQSTGATGSTGSSGSTGSESGTGTQSGSTGSTGGESGTPTTGNETGKGSRSHSGTPFTGTGAGNSSTGDRPESSATNATPATPASEAGASTQSGQVPTTQSSSSGGQTGSHVRSAGSGRAPHVAGAANAASRSNGRLARHGAGGGSQGNALIHGGVPAAGAPSGTGAGLPAAAGTAAGLAASHGSGAGRNAHENGTGDSHQPTPPPPSPVVRTVERIVGVVPGPVWFMIGILALLSVGFAASSWGATLRARRLARQRERLASDVGLLQAALLPTVPDRIGPLRISVAYHPAEGPAAGGDFYDVFALGESRVGVVVGDVSGHGRSALPQTALIRYTLRTYLETGLTPRAALAAASVVLEPQLEGETYATVAVATVDLEAGALTYACAGHPAPIVLGTEEIEPVQACASPPIGVGLPTGLRQTALWLDGPTQICFFTDGLMAAREEGGRVGMDRLSQMVTDLGPTVDANRLLAHLVARTDHRPDDMAACMLALERTPARSPVRTEEVELDAGELATDRPQRFLAALGLTQERIEATLAQARGAVARAGRAILLVGVGSGAPTVDVLARRISSAQAEGLESDGPSLVSTLVS